MTNMFGKGIEMCVPELVSSPGEEPILRPTTVTARPCISAVTCLSIYVRSKKHNPPKLNPLSATRKATDEDMAPFKAMTVLQTQGLRVYIEPEPLHNYWNSVKAAVRKANLEPALLIGLLLTRIDHGPFLSGSNWVGKNECVRKLASEMSDLEFNNLVEDMMYDRARLHTAGDVHGSNLDADLPVTKEDLLTQEAVTTTGIYVMWAAS